MPNAPFDLILPRRLATGVVFASPHSGRDYPADLMRRTVLDGRMIRSSEDAFLDLLLADVPDFGAPLLLARMPRAYVDLNRARDELDPALIADLDHRPHNPRVAAGLGVIPRVVAGSRAIYRGKIHRNEAEARLQAVWDPYHACLRDLVRTAHETFGESVLIDMHSMPHDAIAGFSIRGGRRPEIVIGDRYGSSASPRVIAQIEQAFESAGFCTTRNSPFAGAYTVQAYGRPVRGIHAVQIEIDRALYMDETRIAPHAGFESFRQRLNVALGQLADIGRRGDAVARRIAAE